MSLCNDQPSRKGASRLRKPALVAALLAVTGAAAASEGLVAILDGSSAAALLKQCSRSAPPPGEATWMPAAADVERLEALLPRALADAGRGDAPDGARVLERQARQYVGIVRGGRRFLYASFIPAGFAEHSPDWRARPVIICDGGPSFFGIEMDVAAGTISHLAFNGAR